MLWWSSPVFSWFGWFLVVFILLVMSATLIAAVLVIMRLTYMQPAEREQPLETLPRRVAAREITRNEYKKNRKRPAS